MITLSAKQTKAWKKLQDHTTKEIFYGGAAGGGKSMLGCIWHITQRATYPGTRGLIGRSVLKNLKDSTLVTFFDVAKKMGYVSGKDFVYKQQESIIKWANGSTTVLKDLYLYPKDPDFASLGSTEFTDSFIDEGTEITLKAFDIVKSRLRYKHKQYGLIPKLYITGNPAPGWVKDRYVKDIQGDPIKLQPYQAYIQATVFDNPDPDFVKSYSELLNEMSSDYDRARLLEGDWDVEAEVKAPFLTTYDESKHVGETKFNRNALTRVLIDFNVNPFSASVFNVWHDGTPHVHQVDEIELVNGTISGMADAIKIILGEGIYTADYGGDFMGTHARIGNSDNKSLFKELQTELGVSWQQFKLVSNPRHKTSRDQCAYFLKHFPDFKVGTQCVGSRRDYRTVQVDAYGSILKKKRSDESQRADFLDNFRYLVNTFFKSQIDMHKKTGRWS